MLTIWTSRVDQRLWARRIAVLALTAALAMTGVAVASADAHAGVGDNPVSVRWR